ncbi:ABC transporter permease/M1 family aminopeptidase [Pedobacter kyonggii]|nr:M1 family aminopeptidase [Pedobacter kyonggii]
MITKGITNETFQALLDPFSLTTLTKATKGWGITDRNTLLIPVSGIMLFNKFFWLGLGILALAIGYIKFKLIVSNEKVSHKKQLQKVKTTAVIFTKCLPSVTPVYDMKAKFIQLLLNAWFHSLSILKLISFWAIILCCFIVILVNSVSLGTSYGVDSYPTTYFIIEELREMSIYFFMIILVFYAGEIIWKEKDIKFNLIHDATPLSSFVNLSSRFLGLLLIYAIVMLSLIVAGILFQTLNGYYHYELDVYFFGFFLELFPFLALYTFAAIFFQALTGNKFMGMLATIAFAIINVAIGVFGLEHALLNFGGQALASYSDMNGYGHFLTAYLWVKIYWVLFGLLLLIFASILMAKGNETGLRKRWTSGLKQIGRSVRIFSLVCLTLFISIGSYIFYNTNVLNEFWTKGEQSSFRAGYEKTLKQFEYMSQLKITAVNLKIDLFPSKRAYQIKGEYLLTNTSPDPIRQIHVQKLLESNITLTDVIFNRRATTYKKYEKYHYTIYQLDQALAPGKTLKMNFKQSLQPKGFEADNSDIDVVANGTFFDNAVLPSFGYQKKYELQEEDDRKDFELLPRKQKAKRNDVRELTNARSGSDSDGINLDVVISTAAPQTALTSGNLVAKWNTNGRNYFHYKTNQQIINFYPIVSADYKVMRDTSIPLGNTTNKPVDLEIYYQKGHEYNLNRMMESMKMSLGYYSKNFSPYQYGRLRIVEFPRYRAFAQSLPGIIPFSEALGFVMDIDDQKDVDMAFYITAHEVSHQWWGLQLEAANVQGQNMILETLAQYSAIMVLKEKYSDKKVQQFLKFQSDEYNQAKLKSGKKELPLALVENEEHIYYNKGAVAMYQLQQQIGEAKVNKALQHFLNDWRSFNKQKKLNRYATTIELIQYFRGVAPDSKQHMITDLFERIKPLKQAAR